MGRAQNGQLAAKTSLERQERRSAVRARLLADSVPTDPFYVQAFVELPLLEQSGANRLVKAMYASNYEAVLAVFNVAWEPEAVEGAQTQIYQTMLRRLSFELSREKELLTTRKTIEQALGVSVDDESLFGGFYAGLSAKRLNVREGAEVMLAQARVIRRAVWAQLMCDILPAAKRRDLLRHHTPRDAQVDQELLVDDRVWLAVLTDIANRFAENPPPAPKMTSVIIRAVHEHAERFGNAPTTQSTKAAA